MELHNFQGKTVTFQWTLHLSLHGHLFSEDYLAPGQCSQTQCSPYLDCSYQQPPNMKQTNNDDPHCYLFPSGIKLAGIIILLPHWPALNLVNSLHFPELTFSKFSPTWLRQPAGQFGSNSPFRTPNLFPSPGHFKLNSSKQGNFYFPATCVAVTDTASLTACYYPCCLKCFEDSLNVVKALFQEALFRDYSERISNETFEVGENCLSIY